MCRSPSLITFGGGTPIAALITLTATSNNDAIITGGVLIHQNFTGTFCITSGPACTGTNYLSGTFIDVLAGAIGGSQFTMGASTPPEPMSRSFPTSFRRLNCKKRALALSFRNVIAPVSICGTTICSFTASQSGTMSANNTVLPPAQLGVVKTPDNGTFTPGSQVGFTIVVSNTAAPGSQPATNVMLSDQLPGNGGLVWSSASPTQGSCTPIVGNLLNCALGPIPPQGSVTVTVTSGPTTPAAACQSRPNPVALATADNAPSAQGSGSLTCTPPPRRNSAS